MASQSSSLSLDVAKLRDEIKVKYHQVATTISHKVPSYVWGGCSVTRGVTQADLEAKNAEFTNPDESAEYTVAIDRVVSI